MNNLKKELETYLWGKHISLDVMELSEMLMPFIENERVKSYEEGYTKANEMWMSD